MKHVNAAGLIAQIKAADAPELARLKRALAHDGRKSVAVALQRRERALKRAAAEDARVGAMYDFERRLAGEVLAARARVGAKESSAGAQAAQSPSQAAAAEKSPHDIVILGLDEVGRGPVAGPLAVGGVVLGDAVQIAGLNDSKQVKPAARKQIAEQIKARGEFCTVQYINADFIDGHGITAALTRAFTNAIAAADAHFAAIGKKVDVILLDGNPMRLDPREQNVVKGDAKCASIAAASILAKVDRDAYMARADARYPGYGWAQNAGYGTKAHEQAIQSLGLTPLHRKTYCASLLQKTLF